MHSDTIHLDPVGMRQDPRLAGGVLRWHTWPHLKPETLAEHQWNVARIIYAICPDPSPRLIREALFHDIGEIVSGDTPYPVKANNPTLKTEVDRIENQGRLEMCLPWDVPAHVELELEEKRILKLADMIDMWEWAMKESMMGNQFAGPVIGRALNHIRTIVPESQSPKSEPWHVPVNRYISKRISTWG